MGRAQQALPEDTGGSQALLHLTRYVSNQIKFYQLNTNVLKLNANKTNHIPFVSHKNGSTDSRNTQSLAYSICPTVKTAYY